MSNSSHFPAIVGCIVTKPVTFPPGCGKLATKPLPIGSVQRDEFFGELLDQRLVQRRPAIVDSDVAALRPPKLLESLPECGDEGLPFPVALGKPHQHTDPPHTVGLLRARRNRPRDRRANKREELAPSHSRPPELTTGHRICLG